MRRRRELPFLALFAGVAASTAPGQQVSFAQHVLPILSDRCFPCHGPDAGARKGELRLDDRDDAMRPRDGYAIVLPFAPERSELLHRIAVDADDELHMPPRSSKLSLSANEVATLRRWIEQGAEWTQHWSFAPIDDGDPPPVADPDWPQNGIDHFVLAPLERDGRSPNRAAEAFALLRRVTLDLTGLPPTPAAVDAFTRDPSDANYRRVVDALLASPHYGERMAWPWLEAARYADTDGFQNDPTRTVWPWRDWLVAQLNDNVPFDRLTVAMLAGDLLAGDRQDGEPSGPDDDLRLATAFLRHNAHNGEGGRIPEETRVENGFDRTETVATVWLGMTFECARCHDHKYDPIAQRDYYRLYAFFDRSSETGAGRSGGVLPPAMRYVTDADARRNRDRHRLELDAIEARLFAADPELDRRQQLWEHERIARLEADDAARTPTAFGPWQQSRQFEAAPDQMFAMPFAPEQEALDGTAAAQSGWRDEPRLVDGKTLALPQGQFTTYFRRTITAATARRLALAFGSDDAIKVWVDGELVLQNDVRRGAKADQERVEVELAAGDHELLVKIVNTGGIGGIWFEPRGEGPADLPSNVVAAMREPHSGRSREQQRTVTAYFRAATDPQLQALQARADELRKVLARIDASAVQVSVMDQLPPERSRATPIYARGDYQVPGDIVQPGTPSFLPELAARGEVADRLDLARWLVRDDHPLVARVAANRAWQTFFGRGLVGTSEDFGRQGERPTHPGLLDWLARRYVQSGWNTKELHRLIVTSRTYRQASTAAADVFQSDPDNARLQRYPRRRMPAWMLRDQALALSGNLVARLGGEPVRPYQPDGIWAEATFGFIRYQQGTGDELYRRSLYTFWRRIVGPTMLFDTPARQSCVVRRATTNTPLHALTTLNETGFVEAARGLAARALAQPGDAETRIAWLFRTATARAPDAAELERLHRRFEATRQRFAAGDLDATQLLDVGASRADPSLAPDELAAMACIASLVLNLDEMLCLP